MELKDILYQTLRRRDEADGVTMDVRLIADCAIYRAHFPGNPITPGACIVQTALELLRDLTGRELEIGEVRNAKFLRVVSPVERPQVSFVFRSVEAGAASVAGAAPTVSARVDLRDGDETLATLSMTCEDERR